MFNLDTDTHRTVVCVINNLFYQSGFLTEEDLSPSSLEIFLAKSKCRELGFPAFAFLF